MYTTDNNWAHPVPPHPPALVCLSLPVPPCASACPACFLFVRPCPARSPWQHVPFDSSVPLVEYRYTYYPPSMVSYTPTTLQSSLPGLFSHPAYSCPSHVFTCSLKSAYPGPILLVPHIPPNSRAPILSRLSRLFIDLNIPLASPAPILSCICPAYLTYPACPASRACPSLSISRLLRSYPAYPTYPAYITCLDPIPSIPPIPPVPPDAPVPASRSPACLHQCRPVVIIGANRWSPSASRDTCELRRTMAPSRRQDVYRCTTFRSALDKNPNMRYTNAR